MAWEHGRQGGSTTQWRKTRAAVLKRDRNRCQLQHQGCTMKATEVHHLTAIAAGAQQRRDAIDPRDCIAVCADCHRIETRKQATAGRNRWKLRAERHPGLI
jgi:5-methylcytosine-specific restriction endonuclease McrA